MKINIDDPQYSEYGGSKGKRLRRFLQKADDKSALKVLEALWEHRKEYLLRTGQADPVARAEERYRTVVERLGGKGVTPASDGTPAALIIDPQKLAKARTDLIQISGYSPQARGYAFEAFLKDLFEAFGFAPQDPFRLRGEQIDGSFLLGNETYLLEAKWQASPVGASELRDFHGKLEEKAAWARGLFVSTSGFTEDGLQAFGRGKRLICMDGLDLNDTLQREIPLNNVLERKVRKAAETGSPFARVRDLFPQ